MPCKKTILQMKKIGLLIFTLCLIYSCANKSTNETESKTNKILVPVESSKEPSTKKTEESDNSEIISNPDLAEVFEKAVECFPNDSASLYRFYFKWNATTDQEKIEKQIKRLQNLTSKESVDKYRDIENYLKPIMTKIVNSKAVTKSQSDSLVKLYSDFDYFSGESLFSQLLKNDDNYNLVWQSFRIMAKESSKDTCFISGLIELENNIRTNAELAEAMGDFVVTSIQNNPTGFLDMYSCRKVENRSDFANYIAVWDDPDKELIEKYTEISENSTDKKYKKLATELIEKFKN